jgi:hypothetical protein
MGNISVSMEVLEDRQLFSAPATPFAVQGGSEPAAMSVKFDAADKNSADTKQAKSAPHAERVFGELQIIAVL